ncbi:MAG: enoyl-CoA hydratase/isomerase family protein, partial [Rhodobacteraceae bacterium]|nr:enoyl-CoA hydratase/isomerase family protein [Paracoccaceae bacterium]
MNQHPPPHAGPLRGAEAPAQHVTRRVQDGVAVLSMAGPDGNRLGPDLVAALDHALAVAWRDEGVRAVVLTGRGADFCAGPWSDLPPPGPEPVEPAPVIAALVDLCSALASAPKPVVCALHGRVNAGGLALALAAQGCVADTRATLHFPEPRLGRLPPGSGAVRLAWRVGAAEALRL